MADTASLIARVKTDGADAAAKDLDNFAASAAKADKASDALGDTAQKASPKLKGFGTGAQQIGYQVQDMIVQIQGGTSAFVAIGQQGSQLAGAFGPGGAVIGAIIALSAAVAGTLVKALGAAGVSAEELKDSSKNLDDVLQKNKSGAYELSDSFVTLANNIDTASQAQAKFYQAQSATVTQTEGAQQSIKGLVDDLDTWTNGSAIGAQRSLELGDASRSLAGYIGDLSDKFGVTNDEARGLVPLLAAVQRNASPENVKALTDETARLNDKYGGTNAELVKFNGELFKNQAAMQTAQAQADALSNSQDKLSNATNSTTQRLKEQNDQIIKNVQIGNLADKQRYAAQAAADKEAFAKREGVTEDQIKQYNAARDEEARQDIQRVTDSENKKTEAVQKAADRRAESEAKSAARKEESQKQQAANFLDTVARQNQDELKAIDAQEQQKLAKLEEYRNNEAISQQEYEAAKTQIAADEETARQEEIAKRQKKARDEKQKGDDFMTQIQGQNATELELLDLQEQQKLAIAKKYRDEGIINEQQYQKAVQNIGENYNKKREDSYMDSLGTTTDNLKTALGEGNALYKAAAITETVINTYKAATAAYSALAPIPLVGPALGIAAAAAATAAGLATVGKIRSAREQGGNLAAGQISTIAERGAPEVIMPAGASRVRTAQQMRQIMGENGSNGSGAPNVQIINQTSGRVDSVQTEQTDDNKLRILIRETVTNDLQDSNSSISKTRRGTRGLPGH